MRKLFVSFETTPFGCPIEFKNLLPCHISFEENKETGNHQ